MEKKNATCGSYDWIAVSNPQEAENILREIYGDKTQFIKNLVWRSHGAGQELN